MSTATQRVISFHYTLTDPQGQTLDSSVGDEPLSYLEGVGQIIPGLERQLALLSVGDKRKISVPSGDAYGTRSEELIIRVEKTQVPKQDVVVGDMFQIQDPSSPPFTVVHIDATHVVLDGNHPLAGIDLTFDVEVTGIRNATADELTHGHAHGAHGHGHDH